MLERFQLVRACWDALFLPRIVKVLELDNAKLRAQVEYLQGELAKQRLPLASYGSNDLNDSQRRAMPQMVAGAKIGMSKDDRKRIRTEQFADDLKQPAAAPTEEVANVQS